MRTNNNRDRLFQVSFMEKSIRYRNSEESYKYILIRPIRGIRPPLLSILKYALHVSKIVLFPQREAQTSPDLFIPHRANIFYTVRSFLHPFAVYLATTFYLRPVRVPLPRYSSEVKAEHRFLHSWRDKSSVFLSPCLQRGVKAKATQNTVLSFLP